MNVFRTGFFALLFCLFIGEGQTVLAHSNSAAAKDLSISNDLRRDICMPDASYISDIYDDLSLDDDDTDNLESSARTVSLIGALVLLFLFLGKNINQSISLFRQTACFLKLLTSHSFLRVYRL